MTGTSYCIKETKNISVKSNVHQTFYTFAVLGRNGILLNYYLVYFVSIR